jgi:aryl-alcohol dehydrogenase-like predicted oxidoreductase
VWGPTTEAESMRTIHRALELGVNLFDVAPGYGSGKAEEVLGRALHGIRMKLSIDHSRKRLGVA